MRGLAPGPPSTSASYSAAVAAAAFDLLPLDPVRSFLFLFLSACFRLSPLGLSLPFSFFLFSLISLPKTKKKPENKTSKNQPNTK